MCTALAHLAKRPGGTVGWWRPLGVDRGVPTQRPAPYLGSAPSIAEEQLAANEITQSQTAVPTLSRVERNRIRSDPCNRDLPSALSFVEPLNESIRPDQVVIFTGGDSLQRRQSGFPLLSAQSISQFAEHHGYGLVFLDQVDYDKTLTHGNVTFHPMWHRIFALPSIRQMFPDAKYFVQMDDDILAPYKETDMLNHYINLMEKEGSWMMTYGEEPGDLVLNAGFFIMKNADFCFDAYETAMDIGLENNGHLAHFFGHEQEAIIQYRKRNRLYSKIRVIKRRQGPYNFNTFARNVAWDKPAGKARRGDAFVHFLGQPADVRVTKMTALIRESEAWYSSRPQSCRYPVQYI